jgi:NAD-dependent deacetylase
MIDSVEEARGTLAALIGDARRAVAFTGAGISTECGVPDFRSPGTPWRRYPPIDYGAFRADPAMRVEAWRRKFAMDDLYAGARPGRTHWALANLAGAGRLAGVITQNIDGLQQQAGLPASRLVELHGNGTYATCLSCDRRHELAQVRNRLDATGEAPACDCGGMVKSATVAFGQALPPEALARARDLTLGCDLFVALGSSLLVQPAAALPLLARRNGAVLVIVNREPTRLDCEADLVIRGDVGEVMQPWAGAA